MNRLSGILDYELSQALGWTFIHSLWQGCLLMILFLVANKVFRFNSLGKYWGALMTMTMMLLASIFTLNQYLSSSEIVAQFTEASVFIASTVQQLEVFEGVSLVEPYLPIIASLWLLGAIFFAIRLCGGFVQIHRLKRTAVCEVSEEWSSRLDQLLIKAEVNKTVRLLQSAKVNLPMVLGYFKPVILLPVGIISGLSTAQVDAILLHELSHIKRHDFLINIFQSIIEVIFYYHPVIWWLSSQVRQEREHCCDDQIIAYGVNRITYAKALANVQHISFTQNKLTMGLANDKNDLLNRIKRLVEGQDQSHTNSLIKGIPLLALIAVLMSFSWYQRAHQPKEQGATEMQVESASKPLSGQTSIYRIPAKDTIITEHKPDISESNQKTTKIWTDDEGTSRVLMQDLDEGGHLSQLDDLLADMDFDIDLGHVFEDLAELHDLDNDMGAVFDESFDFHFNGMLDTIPERHLEHMRRVEEGLAHFKESMSRLHEDFEEIGEMSEEQVKEMKMKMQAMELKMHEKMELRDNFKHKELQERVLREELHEMRRLREKERSMQRRELRQQQEEFSTQKMEQKMNAMEKELAEREVEMKVFEKKYEGYQKELIKQLKSDGYLKKGEKLQNLEMSDDHIKVNGKSIDGKDLDKYRKLKDKHLAK